MVPSSFNSVFTRAQGITEQEQSDPSSVRPSALVETELLEMEEALLPFFQKVMTVFRQRKKSYLDKKQFILIQN